MRLTIINSDERDQFLLPTTALYCIMHIQIYMATLWSHGSGGVWALLAAALFSTEEHAATQRRKPGTLQRLLVKQRQCRALVERSSHRVDRRATYTERASRLGSSTRVVALP